MRLLWLFAIVAAGVLAWWDQQDSPHRSPDTAPQDVQPGTPGEAGSADGGPEEEDLVEVEVFVE